MSQALNNLFKSADRNSDGKLTLSEIEEGVQHNVNLLHNRFYSPFHRFFSKHQYAADLSVGWMATLFGGNYSHCFLAYAAFVSSNGNQLKKDFMELVNLGKESRNRFKEVMGDRGVIVENSPSAANRGYTVSPHAGYALLQSVDPERLLRCFRSLYSGFLAALVAVVNDNAAKLGIGLQLGAKVSSFLLAFLDKLLPGIADQNSSNSDPNESDEQIEFVANPGLETNPVPLNIAWARLGVKSICGSIGVFISWRLKALAGTWAVCHYGGSRVAKGVCHLANHKDPALEETFGLAIAAYGFYHHAKNFNAPALPFWLGMVATPFTLLEVALRSATLATTT